MSRAKPLAVVASIALYAVLSGAAARPLPIASQDETDAFVEQTYVRLCYWNDGHLQCIRHRGEAAASAADDGRSSGYYAAPGVYLDFGRPYMSLRDAAGGPRGGD